MKFPTLLAALGLSATLCAQCGTTGDTLVVETGAELATLSGCTSIFGSLLVSDPATSDVDALSQVTSVEEHLLIHNNISLLHVGGLQALETIGGNLEFHNNFTLQSLDGLSALTSIGGDLTFMGNITLVQFDALEGCSFGGDVVFRENTTLASLGGLAGQTTLAGDLILDHQNLVLDDLSPLATLTQVAGDLEVSLPMLTQVQGLSALEEVSGDLRLFDMDLLANLDGLQAMQVIGDTLDLHGNGSMVNIEALAGLDEIGTVDITQNQALMWCCAVANWELNGAVQSTATLEDNHSNCTGYITVAEDCEPLNVATAQAEAFTPGWYQLQFWSAGGRILDARTAWVQRPETIAHGSPGLKVVTGVGEHGTFHILVHR